MVAIKLCCCSYVVVFCCLFGARFDCKTDIKNQVWNRIPPDQMMGNTMVLLVEKNRLGLHTMPGVLVILIKIELW